MGYLIILFLVCIKVSYASCVFIGDGSRSNYKFQCDNQIIEENCDIKNKTCEFKINQKLKKFNVEFKENIINNLKVLESSNGVVDHCKFSSSTITCSQKNMCAFSSFRLDEYLDNFKPKENSLRIKESEEKCLDGLKPIPQEVAKTFQTAECLTYLNNKSLMSSQDIESLRCSFKKTFISHNFDCKLKFFFESLRDYSDKGFYDRCIADSISKDRVERFNSELESLISHVLQKKNFSCESIVSSNVTLEELVCLKIQEVRPGTTFSCSVDPTRQLMGQEAASIAGKNLIQQNTEVKDQPIAEYKRELPTEAPKINHQETLSKIDKLIADNGGNITPEVAQKAGEIFNTGIYQPTKNFLNTVEKVIGSGTSSSSGSKTSRYKSSNNKSYEIGGKGRNNRAIANVITDEIPAATKATVINSKLSSAGPSEVEQGSNKLNSDIKTDVANENKTNSSNFIGNNSTSNGGSIGGAVGGSGIGGLSGGSSGGSNSDIRELPALSAGDKTQISLVMKAIKQAESSEDIKSIVTGEDNYPQVKRMIQELEQKKRQPASAQASNEIKEFEKTLEKFGIKVYGESGPGKAVYAPATVNHVIVLKNNSIQFSNTIRGKK